MKPIDKFAEYNKENILGNLIQAETHLKSITNDTDPEFKACINKHLLEAQVEMSELQVHEPEHQKQYRDMMLKIRRLRNDNINGLSTKDAISHLRYLRGRFEKHVKGHDVSKCKSCGDIEGSIKSYLGQKDLNRSGNEELYIGGNEMARREKFKPLVQPFVGNVGAKLISDYVSPQIPAVIPGLTGKQTGNLGIGLALTALSVYGKLGKGKSNYNLAGAVAGTNLLATELIDLLTGAVAPVPPAVRMAPRAPVGIAPRAPVGVGKAVAANGNVIYVD